MRVEVFSLGGSLIAPKGVDLAFLKGFRKLLLQFPDRKFIVVVGGGPIARMYMHALRSHSFKTRCTAGILVTRLHAWFLASYLGKTAAQIAPTSMRQVFNLLKRNKIIFAGALRFWKHQTSDGTAAQLAHYMKSRFINVTNVRGLYTKDPRRFRDARLIPKISFDDFYAITQRMRYEPGQHFVLDQHAAKIIRKHKILTYIVSGDLRNLQRLLEGKRFIGTTIS